MSEKLREIYRRGEKARQEGLLRLTKEQREKIEQEDLQIAQKEQAIRESFRNSASQKLLSRD